MPESASCGSVYRLVYATSVCSEERAEMLAGRTDPPTVIRQPMGRARTIKVCIADGSRLSSTSPRKLPEKMARCGSEIVVHLRMTDPHTTASGAAANAASRVSGRPSSKSANSARRRHRRGAPRKRASQGSALSAARPGRGPLHAHSRAEARGRLAPGGTPSDGRPDRSSLPRPYLPAASVSNRAQPSGGVDTRHRLRGRQ